jgi:hypothetical protein
MMSFNQGGFFLFFSPAGNLNQRTGMVVGYDMSSAEDLTVQGMMLYD